MPSPDFLPRPTRARQRGLAACLAMATLAFAGCTTTKPLPPPEPAPPPPAPEIVYVPTQEPVDKAARHLLAYQETLSRLPTADLSRELGRLGDGASSIQATMDLALVLGQTRAPGDIGKAQLLLDQVLGNPSPEAQAWHGLARLLAARYADLRRAEDQNERLNQQLRDAQRDNQRKLDQINEKLEALKSIERSLNSRNNNVAPAPQASSAKPASKP